MKPKLKWKKSPGTETIEQAKYGPFLFTVRLYDSHSNTWESGAYIKLENWGDREVGYAQIKGKRNAKKKALEWLTTWLAQLQKEDE